jgi:hypothetical protein
MSTEERIFYESVVGHIELREAIVRRDGIALSRARWLRNAVGVMAIVFVVLRLVEVTAPAPWLRWIAQQDVAIALALIVGLLFAAANIWFARQRLVESRSTLLAYVSSLPMPDENRSPARPQHCSFDRPAAVA